MADNVTKGVRSRIMASIKGKNTTPEIRMRKLLKPLHFTYQPKGLYGRPDFANRKMGVAIFIDGCFWHGCRKHYKEPTSNVAFWRGKISRNKKHDIAVTNALRKQGWQVLRVWEHEKPEDAIGRILSREA